MWGRKKKVEAKRLGEAGWADSRRRGDEIISQRCLDPRLSVSLDLAFSLLLLRVTASCRSCRWEAIAAGTVRQQSWKFCFLGDFVLRALNALAYLSVEYFDGREFLLVVFKRTIPGGFRWGVQMSESFFAYGASSLSVVYWWSWRSWCPSEWSDLDRS